MKLHWLISLLIIEISFIYVWIDKKDDLWNFYASLCDVMIHQKTIFTSKQFKSTLRKVNS